jgi:hypothetical protein
MMILRMHRFRYCWAALLAAVWAPLEAQPVTGLRLVQQGTQLELRLSPASGFGGLVSNVQATLKAPAGASLSGWAAPAAWLPIGPSGPPVTIGDTVYQRVSGTGLLTLAAAGQPWNAGDTPPVLYAASSTSAAWTLAGSGWTGLENGAAYVELDGVPVTGAVRSEIRTSVYPEPAGWIWDLYPNPASGSAWLRWEGVPLRGWILRDLQGREVLRGTLQGRAGQQRIPLGDLPAGLYMVQPAGPEGIGAPRLLAIE